MSSITPTDPSRAEYRAKAREELRKDADAALSELPSVYQAIGTTAAAAKRCKPTSKRGLALWRKYDELNRQGADLSARVRLYITVSKEA